MTRQELTVVLRQLRIQAGSALVLSRQLGLSASNHIPRLLDEQDPIQPSVPTCLHIAALAGRHPNEILQAAGHEELIPILEAAYGATRKRASGKPPIPFKLEPAVWQLFELWSDADNEVRESLKTLLEAAAKPHRKRGSAK
jgi:hypothetical protein